MLVIFNYTFILKDLEYITFIPDFASNIRKSTNNIFFCITAAIELLLKTKELTRPAFSTQISDLNQDNVHASDTKRHHIVIYCKTDKSVRKLGIIDHFTTKLVIMG